MVKLLTKLLLSYPSILPFIVFDDVPDDLCNIRNYGQKQKNRIAAILAGFWIVTVAVLIFSILYFNLKLTTFIVSADVEKVSISPVDNQVYPVWQLNNATIHADCDVDKTVESGRLFPDARAYIELLRIQQGDLIITLDNDESESTGYFLTNKNVKIPLQDCASILLPVNDDTSYIFPLEGGMDLGGEIKESSDRPPILYDGEVSILDKPFFFGELYKVGPFDLELGDKFLIEKLEVKSFGFAYIDSEDGLKVNYSSKGKKAYIRKYKTEKIEIKNGFWTKISNDPSLIIFWLLWIGIYAGCRTGIRISLSKPEENSSFP